jgi:hypothetical protein
VSLEAFADALLLDGSRCRHRWMSIESRDEEMMVPAAAAAATA